MPTAPPADIEPPRPGALTLALLTTLPWLWPWAPGPSAQVVPLMAAWSLGAAALLMLMLSPAARAQAALAVAAAWLTAALASSAMALAQWFGVADALPLVQPTAPGEAFANLRQRNLFASLTSLGLLALLTLRAQQLQLALRPALHPQSRPDDDAFAAQPRWPAVWYAGAALLALGNAASLSRTGALQWLVIVGVAALCHRPSRRLALVALAAYGAGTLLLPWALSALQGGDTPSLFARMASELGCRSRTVLWSNMLHLIAQRPWGGWGAGELDYAHYATLYPGARFCEILDNAHNLPLHLAVEFGLPLALAVCGVVAWWALRAAPWREREPQRVLAWGALGVIGLHSLVEAPLWYGPFQLAAVAALTLLVWPRRPAARTACLGRDGSLVQTLGLAATLAAFATLSWASACYWQVSQAYLEPEARSPAFREDPLRGVRPGPFVGHAAFAELNLTPLSSDSAERVHALALRLLHFSPEPKVVQAVIESAMVLGRDDEALWHLARFRAAFPAEHADWSRTQRPRAP